jgi:hypothetical protein
VIITLVFEINANFFCRKLAKIAENCDHNIDPWRGFYRKGKTFRTPEKGSFLSTTILNCSTFSPETFADPDSRCEATRAGAFFKDCPGWEANLGSFDFVYFLIPSLYR